MCTCGSFCRSAVAVHSCVADTIVVQLLLADTRQASTVPSGRGSCTVSRVIHKLLVRVGEQNLMVVHVLYEIWQDFPIDKLYKRHKACLGSLSLRHTDSQHYREIMCYMCL